MTNNIPTEENDSKYQLEQARATYALLKSALHKHLSAFENQTNIPSPTVVASTLNSHIKLLVLIHELEVKLEKRSELIRTKTTNTLDLKAARADIFRRLTRIVERS